MGQLDSAGMRGAITLFLSWLFWKKGGYLYKENTIIDNGGITFLKNIVKSSVCGWESLGLAYGKPTDTLFMEFVEEINKQRYLQSEYDYKIDPVTREPIDFFCNMKEYFFNGQNICLSFPNVKSVSDDISLLPYSFLLLEEISFASNEILEINVDKIQSNCIFSC